MARHQQMVPRFLADHDTTLLTHGGGILKVFSSKLGPYDRYKQSYKPFKWPYKCGSWSYFIPINGVMGPYF